MIEMKTSFTLTEADIREAIKAYIKDKKGVEVRYVYLSYYQADTKDPRESSYHSATATE